MSWNPDQYLKFSAPRFRPAQDLVARITHERAETIYDLGCGTGNVTELLAERWPEARVTGIDDSGAMLEKARATLPQIEWVQQSIAAWQPDTPADIIFSNAALHWLDDHASLFPKLFSFLAPNGILAVQMPRNFGAPSHTLVTEAARNGPWADRLAHLIKPAPVAEPSTYYDLLASQAQSIDLWETSYLQALSGPNPVKEWTKGTWLKPFLDALQEPHKLAFEEDYARRVEQAYPPRADGITLFPFKRLFIVARKAA